MIRRGVILSAAAAVFAAAPAGAQEPALAKLELRPGVTLEVSELRRVPDKGVVLLRFRVANGAAEAVSLEDLRLSDKRSLEGVSLLDFKNGREYVIGNGYSGC